MFSGQRGVDGDDGGREEKAHGITLLQIRPDSIYLAIHSSSFSLVSIEAILFF